MKWALQRAGIFLALLFGLTFLTVQVMKSNAPGLHIGPAPAGALEVPPSIQGVMQGQIGQLVERNKRIEEDLGVIREEMEKLREDAFLLSSADLRLLGIEQHLRLLDGDVLEQRELTLLLHSRNTVAGD